MAPKCNAISCAGSVRNCTRNLIQLRAAPIQTRDVERLALMVTIFFVAKTYDPDLLGVKLSRLSTVEPIRFEIYTFIILVCTKDVSILSLSQRISNQSLFFMD